MAKKKAAKANSVPWFDRVDDLIDAGKLDDLRQLFASAKAKWADYLAMTAGAFEWGEYLAEAAERGNLELVQLLVELGERTNATSEEDLLAILAAAQAGHAEVVDYLRPLTNSKSSVRQADEALKNRANRARSLDDKQLLAAARSGDLAAFQAALSQGGNAQATNQGSTPLVQVLVEKNRGAMLDILFKKHGFKPTKELLQAAVLAKAPESIDALMRHGLPPDTPLPDKSTALMHAAASGSLECVRVLLKAGADARAQNDRGETALFPVHTPFRKANAAVLAELIKAGADPRHRSRHRLTGLENWLAHCDRKEFDSFYASLLKHGVVDRAWNTLLRQCIDAPMEELIPSLTKANDLNATGEVENDPKLRVRYQPDDKDGSPVSNKRCLYVRVAPLHMAVAHGREDLADWLLERGANPDIRGLQAWPEHGEYPTPLSLAVYRGHLSLVKRLLAAGADPTVHVGARGQSEYSLVTLIEYARDQKKPTIAKHLKTAIEGWPAK